MVFLCVLIGAQLHVSRPTSDRLALIQLPDQLPTYTDATTCLYSGDMGGAELNVWPRSGQCNGWPVLLCRGEDCIDFCRARGGRHKHIRNHSVQSCGFWPESRWLVVGRLTNCNREVVLKVQHVLFRQAGPVGRHISLHRPIPSSAICSHFGAIHSVWVVQVLQWS